MRLVLVLTLLLGLVYSNCRSDVEAKLDKVITKLGKVLLIFIENTYDQS